MEALIGEVCDPDKDYPDACLPVLQLAASSEPSEGDLNSIYIHSDTIYRHHIFEISYDTYDCRHDTDTINPRTSRRDFVCLPAQESQDGTLPSLPGQRSGGYVYGRVMGIFHANVVYSGSGSLDYRRRRFDFLWVRWFTGASSERTNIWSSKRLERLKLAPLTAIDSWDFVDPAHVLRCAHIIPRFSLGPLYDEKDADRIFSKAGQDQRDWKEYYVNPYAVLSIALALFILTILYRFVDRDMTMRFHPGLGVGHHPSSIPGAGSSAHLDAAMEVDVADCIPASQSEDVSQISSSDYQSDSSGEDSDDFGWSHVPEPDSEGEPEIYE